MKPIFKEKSFEFEGVTFRLPDSPLNILEPFEAIREGNFSMFNTSSKRVNELLKEQKMMAKIQQEQIKLEREKQERLEAEQLKAEWNERQAKVEAFRKKLEVKKN